MKRFISPPLLIALTAAVAAIAVSAGVAWYQLASGGKTSTMDSTLVTPQVRIGGPFQLINHRGETVSEADFKGKFMLAYFGYSFCPDVCPLDNSRNVEAIDILESRGQMVTPVFISIDPNRDTPDVVGDFAANLHERMIGLTGSPEQVKAASKAYKTYFKRQEGDEDYYLIDNSTFSYLVFPEDGFVEFFRRDLTPEDMADRIGCFLDKM